MSKYARLGDIAEIYSGGTPSRKNPAYWGGNIPWIKTAQIQNSLITEDGIEEWITEQGLKHSSSRIVPKGTILMAMYGQGKTRGQVSILGMDAAINQACAAIQTRKGSNRDFIFQQLLFRYNSIRSLSNTGSQENLNAWLIRSIEVPLPSLSEQTAIADILSNWDQAIEKTERLIVAKQEHRKWFMQQLLTGKRRLPGFKKSNEFRKTPFGALPADWGYPKIGEVAKEVSERNGDNATRPVLSCTKHQGLVDSLTYFGKRIFSEDLSNYKVVHQHQFAYATNHIEEGSIGYQDAYDEALISPIYTVFQASDAIDDRFLFLILKTDTYRHIFSSNTSASVDRRGSLRWRDFAKIRVPRPSIEEQSAIVKVINTADRELALLRSQSDALLEQKKGLMQQLLTGKRRVKLDNKSR
jgi:type I restriction enzyme S subunit